MCFWSQGSCTRMLPDGISVVICKNGDRSDRLVVLIENAIKISEHPASKILILIALYLNVD